MGVMGVLLSSTATAAVIFILNVIVFKKMGIQWQPSLKGFDKGVLKKLSAFSLMAIASGFLVPLGQILVRDRIIQKLSLPEAGYWQAITRISDYYLGFITSVLGVYYLPRLSEIMNRAELKKEIIKGYKTILPVVAAIALSVWLLRGLVIKVLFTPVFLAMKPLFTFQLLGDFFKIGSWLLAYLLLARARIKTFIFTELIFVLSYVLLSCLFIEVYGLIGTTYAFCINYAVYWIVIWIITRKQIAPEIKE
jgi:O-antigen/teichoic acid export membrane protein